MKKAFLNHIIGEIQDCELNNKETDQVELAGWNEFSDYQEKLEEARKKLLSANKKDESKNKPSISTTTTEEEKTKAPFNPFQTSNKPTSFGGGSLFQGPSPTNASNNGSSAPPKFTGFSFVPKQTSTPTAASTATAKATTENADGEYGFPKEKPEEALSAENPDETCVFESSAKHYKLIDKVWKDHGKGKLRLYSHKSSANTHRLVIRNTVGKVQLNIAIGKGMTFEKVDGKKNGRVRFLAMEAGKTEATVIMLMVTLDKIDTLIGELKKMAGAE